MPDVDSEQEEEPIEPIECNPNAGGRPWLYTDKICLTCGLPFSACFGHDQ